MDLALGRDRPYSLVTTVVRRRGVHCKLIQLDLHLRSGDIRFRFEDAQTLRLFSLVLTELLAEVVAPGPSDCSPVRTRIYTDTATELQAHAPIQRPLP